MSRSILVSDSDGGAEGGVGVVYSTTIFEAISEGIRANFESGDSECMRKCFEDLDDLGAEYICLFDVDAFCFGRFVGACERALLGLRAGRALVIRYQATDGEIDLIIRLFEELLTLLQADPRWAAGK